jgi:hypothetical protein
MSEKNQNRREFIKSWGRNFLVGGLFFSTGWLIVQNNAKEKNQSDGAISTPCQQCQIYKKCTLPRAQALKVKK